MSPANVPALLSTLAAEYSEEGELASQSDSSSSTRATRGRLFLRAAGALAVAGGVVAAVLGGVSAAGGGPSAGTSALREATRLVAAQQPAAAASFLKPIELMHDGNVCDYREELFGGLCYKKCALLTNGEASIRTSPWTCCKGHPCTPMNEVGSIGGRVLCSGFDVGGDGSCPHKPGACLLDEELHLGICYKKCRDLTGGEYPHRVAAATCCRTSGLACMLLSNSKTSNAFDVGGGAGDHDASTLAFVHPPQQSLTEAADAGKVPAASAAVGKLVGAGAGGGVWPEHAAPEHAPVGNACAANEEFFGGLCYKRCSVLTNGEAPIRTSSWTCCTSRPCGFTNQRGAMGGSLLCNGYDVGGTGSCPHKPGGCLEDEEMHLGVCYKKCSLLTNGAFPHRFAAATCCKTGLLGCLDFRNDLTNAAFDVGGGNATA